MNLFQSTLLLIFGIIFFMMLIDQNVSDYINLIFKMWKINIQRWYWMIRFHPKNPITNWIKEQEFKQIAKQMEKEFENKYNENV